MKMIYMLVMIAMMTTGCSKGVQIAGNVVIAASVPIFIASVMKTYNTRINEAESYLLYVNRKVYKLAKALDEEKHRYAIRNEETIKKIKSELSAIVYELSKFQEETVDLYNKCFNDLYDKVSRLEEVDEDLQDKLDNLSLKFSDRHDKIELQNKVLYLETKKNKDLHFQLKEETLQLIDDFVALADAQERVENEVSKIKQALESLCEENVEETGKLI